MVHCSKYPSRTKKGKRSSFNLHCFPGAQGSGKIQRCHHPTGDDNYDSTIYNFNILKVPWKCSVHSKCSINICESHLPVRSVRAG